MLLSPASETIPLPLIRLALRDVIVLAHGAQSALGSDPSRGVPRLRNRIRQKLCGDVALPWVALLLMALQSAAFRLRWIYRSRLDYADP